MGKEQDGNFGAYVSGFLLGGLVGAAVALLLAPQTGEETRALIGEKAIELKDQVDQKASETLTRAEQIAEEAKLRAEKLTEEAKVKASDIQKQGKEIIDTQKTKLEKAIEAGKEPLSTGQTEKKGTDPSKA
jgi:gas vesicle protein